MKAPKVTATQFDLLLLLGSVAAMLLAIRQDWRWLFVGGFSGVLRSAGEIWRSENRMAKAWSTVDRMLRNVR